MGRTEHANWAQGEWEGIETRLKPRRPERGTRPEQKGFSLSGMIIPIKELTMLGSGGRKKRLRRKIPEEAASSARRQRNSQCKGIKGGASLLADPCKAESTWAA